MRVAAMGDSITEGYLCFPQDNWVAIVETELGIKMYNLGVCGDLTRNMRRRFRSQVLPLAPSHCIILGGANDAFCDISLEDYSGKRGSHGGILRQQRHRSHPGDTYALPGLPEEFVLQEYRAWLKEYAEEHSIKVIDFLRRFSRHRGDDCQRRIFIG
jgi:hypothetical protein